MKPQFRMFSSGGMFSGPEGCLRAGGKVRGVVIARRIDRIFAGVSPTQHGLRDRLVSDLVDVDTNLLKTKFEKLGAGAKISRPDCATIRLEGWHRVAMNTENQSSTVAFPD